MHKQTNKRRRSTQTGFQLSYQTPSKLFETMSDNLLLLRAATSQREQLSISDTSQQYKILQCRSKLCDRRVNGPPGFNCWFSFAPVFQWCCSAPRGSPGVSRNTFLSSPHLCFIIVFICDLFVSHDDPLMS